MYLLCKIINRILSIFSNLFELYFNYIQLQIRRSIILVVKYGLFATTTFDNLHDNIFYLVFTTDSKRCIFVSYIAYNNIVYYDWCDTDNVTRHVFK
jgi:hypothetical protein